MAVLRVVLRHRPKLVFSVRRQFAVLFFLCLSVCGLDRTAFAQEQSTEEQFQKWLAGTFDCDLRDGTTLHLPAPYDASVMDPARGYVSHLDGEFSCAPAFQFWLSDGKPIAASTIRAYLTHDDEWAERNKQSPGWFWPAELGRPSGTLDDFVVHVNFVKVREERVGVEGLKGLQRVFSKSHKPTNPISKYGSLACDFNLPFDGTKTMCANPGDDDVLVYFQEFVPSTPHGAMNGYAFSRTARIEVILQFPKLGLPRWREIVCQTYSLIRAWRTPIGEQSADCAKRLSLTRPEQRRNADG